MAGDASDHAVEGSGDGGGVALPLFGGTLIEDWPSHQLRLEAWFRIRSIALDSPQATDCLLLSLRGYAALVYQRLEGSERSTYEKGIGWLTAYFVNETRTRLMRTMAHKKLGARTYREKGRRGEFVMDLVQDLEVLFLHAGIHDQDGAKRSAFIQCFHEYSDLKHRLELSTTRYAEAIDVAMQWESTTVVFQSSAEIQLLSSSGNDKAKATPTGSSISSHHSSFFSDPEYKNIQSSIEASRPESTSSPSKHHPDQPNADPMNELFIVSSLLDEQDESPRPTSSVYFSQQLLSSRSLLDIQRPSAPLRGRTTSSSPTPVAHLVPGPLSRQSREHLVVVGADREDPQADPIRRKSSPATWSQFSIGSLPSEIRHSIQSSQHGIVVSKADDDRPRTPGSDQGVDPDHRSDSRVEQEDTESTGLQLEHTTISPLDSVATSSVQGSMNSSFVQGAASSNRSFEISSHRLPFFEFDEPNSLGLEDTPSKGGPHHRSLQQQQPSHGRSQSAVEFCYGQFGSHDIEGLSINRSVLTESDLPSNNNDNPPKAHLPSTYHTIANEIVGGIVPTTNNALSDLPGGLTSRRMSYPDFTSLGGEKGPLVRTFRFPMFEASTPVVRLCSPDGEEETVTAQEVEPRRESGDPIRHLEPASSHGYATDHPEAPVTITTQDLLREELDPQPNPSLQLLDPQQTLNTRRHRSLFTLGSTHTQLQGTSGSSIARHRHIRGTPRKLAKNKVPPVHLPQGSSQISVVGSSNPRQRQHRHTKTMSLDRILWRSGGACAAKEGRSPKSSCSTTTPTGGKKASTGWKALWGRWFHSSTSSSGKNGEGQGKEKRSHGPMNLCEGKGSEQVQSPTLPEMDLGDEVRARVRDEDHQEERHGDVLDEVVEAIEDVHGGEGRPAKERRGLMMMETRF